MDQAYKLAIVQSARLKFTKTNDMIDKELDVEETLEKVTNEVVSILQSYNFNIFEFSDQVGRKNQMPIVSYGLLKVNKLEDRVKKKEFFNFITSIYNRYSRNVQYHNDLHGSDVAQ